MSFIWVRTIPCGLPHHRRSLIQGLPSFALLLRLHLDKRARARAKQAKEGEGIDLDEGTGFESKV